MTGGEWGRVWRAYSESCEKPDSERAAFVEGCLPEGPLRTKALELLRNLDTLPDIDASLDEDDAAALREQEAEPGQLIGQTLGRFQLQSPIGRGGMGEVYRAVDPELGREVAVKCIPPQRLDEATMNGLIREARTASTLNHPGIVTVHEVIRTPDTVAIVMELVEGESLRVMCGTPQPASLICAWGQQIAEALAASHLAGTVHRDIKPENLILRPDGYLKVLDFGLAAAGVTVQTGVRGGTLRYMSPEQARGETATAASDIFAFGLVLSELATGSHPFSFSGSADHSSVTFGATLATGAMTKSVALPETLPPALRELILSMLSDAAEARPDAATVASTLRTIAGGLQRQWNRGRWVAAVSGVGILCLVAAWWLWRRAPMPAPPQLIQGTLFTGAPGRENSPAFSPDGTSIAYAWDGGAGGRRDIYVRAIQGADPVRLSTAGEDEWAPSWSPDGRFIVFLRQGRGEFDVVVVTAGGDGERVIGSIEQSMTNLRDRLWWSGNAAEVVVADDPPGANLGTCLFAIDVKTGHRKQLTQTGSNSADVNPRTSPRGQWIAFLRVSQAGHEVHVMPSTGGPTRMVARSPAIHGLAWVSDHRIVYGTGGAGFADLWVSDVASPEVAQVRAPWALESEVSEIAFKPNGRFIAYVRKVRDSNFWQVFREGRGEPRKISLSTRADEDAQFSSDTHKIAFSSDRSGNYEIWASDADGTNPRKLTALGAFSASPAWSADGRQLAFDSTSDGMVRVWTVSATGSTAPRLLTPMIDGCVPSWSRDGKFVYFSSRRTGRNEIWRIAAQSPGTSAPQQVTHAGGFESRVSVDGRYLYYSKAGGEGLWRVLLDSDAAAEERVAPFDSRVQFRCWDLAAKTGLVVATATSPPDLQLFPATGGGLLRLGQLPRDLPRFGRCLSAAADAESVLYSVEDMEREEIYLAHLRDN